MDTSIPSSPDPQAAFELAAELGALDLASEMATRALDGSLVVHRWKRWGKARENHGKPRENHGKLGKTMENWGKPLKPW